MTLAQAEFLWLSTDGWIAIGSMASALGLLLAGRGIVLNTRAMEPQLLESIFRDIRELERQLISEFDSWSHEQKNAWSATFFSTVEYLCFLVNSKITKGNALKKFFFAEGLPEWRRRLDEHVKLGLINDSDTMFPELKKAYRTITSP